MELYLVYTTKEHPSEIRRSFISCPLFIIITTIIIYLVVLGNLKLLQASSKSVRNVFPSIKVFIGQKKCDLYNLILMGGLFIIICFSALLVNL